MAPASTSPSWLHCGHGADHVTDPIGCLGIYVPGYAACLAHLTESEREAYLSTLTPGANIDHRGTAFTAPLLRDLLVALRDPADGTVRIGDANFSRARFLEGASFATVQFSDRAEFHAVEFSGDAVFVGVKFHGKVSFCDAQFSGESTFTSAEFFNESAFNNVSFSKLVSFDAAKFSGEAHLAWVEFCGDAWFDGTRFRSVGFIGAKFFEEVSFCGAEFSGHASFSRAVFSKGISLDGVKFSENVAFVETRFAAVPLFGPLICVKKVNLSRAVFEVPVTLEIAANSVICVRTRWESTATLRLRYAELDLTDAVLNYPVAVTSHTAPFTEGLNTLPESPLNGDPGVRVKSVSGVDATHLVLTNVDLNECTFFGAFHLDQIRFEGEIRFARAPAGWSLRRLFPLRWTDRQTIAEEHWWRARSARSYRRRVGWSPGPLLSQPAVCPPGPPALAALYRQLRKAFEDGKNEPGAADFYYGEMEMRRHDRRRGDRSERGLLTAYWALSGYGIRASRAIAWLLSAMGATILALMLWGLPTNDPKPHTTGTQARPGQRVDLTTDTPAPKLTGSPTQLLTVKRAEKATQVVLNSVVFRSSGHNLTPVGTYIEMTARFLEPILLALAVLSIRSRVKR